MAASALEALRDVLIPPRCAGCGGSGSWYCVTCRDAADPIRRTIGSVVVTLFALLVPGYIKGMFTTARPFRRAWQTAIVGGFAATAAFVIAKAIG